MRLTGLVDHPEHVCCRYRLAAFRTFFEHAGHQLELAALPRGWWSGLVHVGATHYDVAILQRRLLSALDLHLLRRNAQHLIFDFDDSIWLRDSYATKGMASARRLRRFVATVKAADTVIAGNAFLAQQARRYVEPARVHVIPTCVKPERYSQADHQRTADTRLVWVGSSSTLRGLEQFREHLDEIGRRVPGVRLKLICDRFLSLQHLAVEPSRWNRATEALEIAASDIGIAWMPDDDWSRGKCGLKVIQYMAAGLPVVANPVGVHAELVRHGETGLLARTPQEWVAAVQMLARNPDLRTRLGDAGRKAIESRYSVACGGETWLGVLRDTQKMNRAA